MNQDIQFEFMGFEPDHDIRLFLSNTAESIHLNSPSDSATKLAIQKAKGAINASCKIASQAGTFFAEAISDNPYWAIRQIEQRIKDQLDNWKAWRFENNPPRRTV